jgi:uncharacterized protein Yka (UPF0111/DUF47 family)
MRLFRAERNGERFTSMLAAQAAKALEAIRFLEQALDDPGPAAIVRLEEIAAQSLEVRRVLIDELHKTFITPLDREDIFSLSRCYHDIVNYAVTTLQEMALFGVAADPHIRRMIGLMREQAQELALAIERLASNPRVAGDHANAVQDKEREVERVYRAAVKALLAGASDPAALPGVLYRREVYRHISNMSDRALDAANLFGMVVMKLA